MAQQRHQGGEGGSRMVIQHYFVGDDDEPTKLIQRDAFGQAISLILDGCSAYARLAIALAGEDPSLKRFVELKRIDRNTLREAHDTMAAYWRFRSGRVHPALPFVPKQEGALLCRDEWLTWLGAEVAGWLHRPDLVRALIMSASAIDARKGWEAEAAAKFMLREQCREMFEDRPDGAGG